MKIFMVLTSQDKLDDPGDKAGFCHEEFAAPYETRSPIIPWVKRFADNQT